MSRDDRPGTEGVYDDPYEDDRGFWPPYALGWWPWYERDIRETYADEGYADEEYAERRYDEYERADDSWWDEGLITLLLLVGIALFLFPEPATSAVGITLIVVAAFLWLLDWAL